MSLKCPNLVCIPVHNQWTATHHCFSTGEKLLVTSSTGPPCVDMKTSYGPAHTHHTRETVFASLSAISQWFHTPGATEMTRIYCSWDPHYLAETLDNGSDESIARYCKADGSQPKGWHNINTKSPSFSCQQVRITAFLYATPAIQNNSLLTIAAIPGIPRIVNAASFTINF